jgi:hypothetical protein
LAIRLYLSALTLVFLIASSLHRGVNALEGIVITCALIYLILEARENLLLVKTDLRTLEDIEAALAKILS